MRHALEIIESEHRDLAAILNGMAYQVQRIRSGDARPDFDAFRAMLYYFDTFSERLHHPKEGEFLFRPLRARGGDADALIDDLEREHACGAVAIRALEQALLRYEAGGEGEFVAFATAAEGFRDFYIEHMRKEESLAMPMAEKLLDAADWGRIDAAFCGDPEAHGGADEDREFRRLFGRIVTLLPEGTRAGSPG